MRFRGSDPGPAKLEGTLRQPADALGPAWGRREVKDAAWLAVTANQHIGTLREQACGEASPSVQQEAVRPEQSLDRGMKWWAKPTLRNSACRQGSSAPYDAEDRHHPHPQQH
jgi:hypothetical protein